MESSSSILNQNIPVVPELVDWTDETHGKVQKLIKEDFPMKVLSFNDLLKNECFHENYIKEIRQEVLIPKACVDLLNDLFEVHIHIDSVRDNPTNAPCKLKVVKAASNETTENQEDNYYRRSNMVSTNNKVKAVNNLLKPKIMEIIEDLNLIQLWILSLIPKIEDGNNFGVSIQQEILSEVRFTLAEVMIIYRNIKAYYDIRAEIVWKYSRSPFIEDYRDYLVELDESRWFDSKLLVVKLQKMYNHLYNLMMKNWDKLICPRSSNSETMF